MCIMKYMLCGEHIATKPTDIIICISVLWKRLVFVFPYCSLGNGCEVKGAHHQVLNVITCCVHHKVTAETKNVKWGCFINLDLSGRPLFMMII